MFGNLPLSPSLSLSPFLPPPPPPPHPWQESGGYNLLKQINALGGADKPAHGIAKLVEWVAAGEGGGGVE